MQQNLTSNLNKNGTGIDISRFAKTDDLANLKSDVIKLDIDELKKV